MLRSGKNPKNAESYFKKAHELDATRPEPVMNLARLRELLAALPPSSPVVLHVDSKAKTVAIKKESSK